MQPNDPGKLNIKGWVNSCIVESSPTKTSHFNIRQSCMCQFCKYMYINQYLFLKLNSKGDNLKNIKHQTQGIFLCLLVFIIYFSFDLRVSKTCFFYRMCIPCCFTLATLLGGICLLCTGAIYFLVSNECISLSVYPLISLPVYSFIHTTVQPSICLTAQTFLDIGAR